MGHDWPLLPTARHENGPHFQQGSRYATGNFFSFLFFKYEIKGCGWVFPLSSVNQTSGSHSDKSNTALAEGMKRNSLIHPECKSLANDYSILESQIRTGGQYWVYFICPYTAFVLGACCGGNDPGTNAAQQLLANHTLSFIIALGPALALATNRED